MRKYFLLLLLSGAFLSPIAVIGADINYEIESGEISGYGQIGVDSVPGEYGGGFSMYAAVWPLVEKYPGNRYQTGLFHTWMFAQYDSSIDTKGMYSCIEGGLGWWRDTRFATETPKFIMGGVALKFSEWANGPGAGKGRDWDTPKGKYAVAQLSSRVLWPPDGLNMQRGSCGELLGYGYRPLPLIEPKASTYGHPISTGNQCWTLFINTNRVKGPIAFFLPEFFSRPAIGEPKMSGQFLDTKLGRPNRPLSMETQYIPAVVATGKNGDTYARVAQILYPRSNSKTDPVLVHNVTAYKKSQLWKKTQQWFQGGAVAPTEFEEKDSIRHKFSGKAGSSWKIFASSTPKNERRLIHWDDFMEPVTPDKHTFGYRWNDEYVAQHHYGNQGAVKLPEFFKLETKGERAQWVSLKPEEVPEETGLLIHSLKPSARKQQKAYMTPDQKDSVWKNPGPVSGPHQVALGDGSLITYYWYRFADQPAIQKSALTPLERENLQKVVDKIHRHWTLEKSYIAEPTVDTPLADIDPALVVDPPLGFEIGYVPIVTKQEQKIELGSGGNG